MIMDYQLALSLKDAGFPQGLRALLEDGHHEVRAYTPTLSELIEACGDEFMELVNYYKHSDPWIAKSRHSSEFLGPEKEGRGSTPEEAVAYLFLNLSE